MKKKIKDRKLSSQELQTAITKLLHENPKKRYNARQIIEQLRIGNNKDSVEFALSQVNEPGLLHTTDIAPMPNKREVFTKIKKETDPRRDTKSKRTGTTIEGRVDLTKSGSAYIVSEQSASDVYVAAKHLNGAMHGDTVIVFTKEFRGKLEGEVQKVVKRATEHFLGTLMLFRKYAIVVADKSNMEIYVDLKDIHDGAHGDKVVVRIDQWHSRSVKSPIGAVTAVLGRPGSHDIEMKSILINKGFNIEFPPEVIAEAEAISSEITPSEIANRRDMRTVDTFTIDPVDAKDFDDALSIRYLDKGHIEIGVHIADVSHYVHTNTALDKEAYFRSTSVYLVDRVCPMLPEKLSNQLCSLRPNEDKLTFSAVFEFDDNSNIVKRWFGKTIIHSNRRFTYEEAQAILETKQGEFALELADMNKIAYKLRAKRFKDGAINFESDEVRFKLDAESNPIEVYVKVRKDSNLLIEDFMLLANREVATFIAEKGKTQEIPYVYRIHDAPDIDKLNDLAKFALEMGVKMDLQSPKRITESLNKLTKEAETNESLRLLLPLAIRTMAKAVYSTDNIGHYGLAFEHYSHFTSPIRRYSDVWSHRILEENLHRDYRMDKTLLETQCKHISDQERKAAEAERESTKYMQVVFAERLLDTEQEGVVSGMLDRGIFIELVNSKCEGLIGFDSFREPFEIADSRLRCRGVRSGRVIKMGDRVTVMITGTNLEKRQIEMALVSQNNEEKV